MAEDELNRKAHALVASVDFDNNGSLGRGGNGGLISRETMRACDELRVLLLQIDRARAAEKDAKP